LKKEIIHNVKPGSEFAKFLIKAAKDKEEMLECISRGKKLSNVKNKKFKIVQPL
jgi:hypothetical protein